jgi:hypothetical protein
VKFYKTPDPILKRQLAAWDKVTREEAAENPLFAKVLESQRAFAQRAAALAERHHRQFPHGLRPLLLEEGLKQQRAVTEPAPGQAGAGFFSWRVTCGPACIRDTSCKIFCCA